MKTCQLCNRNFPVRVKINGLSRNLNTRKYCLVCSPFGAHNTKQLKQQQDITEKHCPKCNEIKPVGSFYSKRKKTGLLSYCKICTNMQTLERQRSLKQLAVEYLGGKCVECGFSGHCAAFDFHHKNPMVKDFTIGQMKLTAFEKIKPELDKCELLCANCHRICHAKYKMARQTGLEPA